MAELLLVPPPPPPPRLLPLPRLPPLDLPCPHAQSPKLRVAAVVVVAAAVVVEEQALCFYRRCKKRQRARGTGCWSRRNKRFVTFKAHKHEPQITNYKPIPYTWYHMPSPPRRSHQHALTRLHTHTLTNLHPHATRHYAYRQVLALLNMLASTPVSTLVDATVMEKRAATELEAVTLQTNDDWNAR